MLLTFISGEAVASFIELRTADVEQEIQDG